MHWQSLTVQILSLSLYSSHNSELRENSILVRAGSNKELDFCLQIATDNSIASRYATPDFVYFV